MRCPLAKREMNTNKLLSLEWGECSDVGNTLTQWRTFKITSKSPQQIHAKFLYNLLSAMYVCVCQCQYSSTNKCRIKLILFAAWLTLLPGPSCIQSYLGNLFQQIFSDSELVSNSIIPQRSFSNFYPFSLPFVVSLALVNDNAYRLKTRIV